jgi:hypothetical protein
MGGITRVHGGLLSPKNFAGVGLQDFTLTFWNGDCYALTGDNNSGSSLAAGAIEQIFRIATGAVGTVSRVGTLSTGTGATANTLNFAIEALGVDANSPGYLGMGPSDASPASTALALQNAIQALATVTDSAGNVIHLTSATVAAFTY